MLKKFKTPKTIQLSSKISKRLHKLQFIKGSFFSPTILESLKLIPPTNQIVSVIY